MQIKHIPYYAVQTVKDASRGIHKMRSSKWPAVRLLMLHINPTCAACGGTYRLQVHHIKPFHLFPRLELVYTNLITLCEDPKCEHHFEIGHLKNWKTNNPNVVADAEKLKGGTK